jgi:hypothetical protein
MASSIFQIQARTQTPPPEVAEVIRYGSKETSKAYRAPLFQKSQAWLKQALVEAHHSRQIKETAVKLLQRDLFCRNLAVYNVERDPTKTLYDDLKVWDLIQ